MTNTGKLNRFCRTGIIMLSALALSGCAGLIKGYNVKKREGSANSLVKYLYPGGRIPPGLAQRIPALKVPIRLGLAFVPVNGRYRDALNESQKAAMLQKIKMAFRNRRIIQDIRIIPSHYLQQNGGFNDLKRVAALYGVEQVALISYDQVGLVYENPLSFTYWTIVGAFIIPGNSHDIQTFLDIGVFDVHSRKLLLRAGGRDRYRRVSTMIHLRAQMRNASQKSYQRATGNVIANLNRELDLFKQRIRQGSREVSVQYRPGFSGRIEYFYLVLMVLTVLLVKRSRRSRV